MATLLAKSVRIHREEYALYWEWVDSPGAGFAVDCDERGNLLRMSDGGRVSQWDANPDLVFRGMRKFVTKFVNPAILQCDCGRLLKLESFTNTCDHCNADYNLSGQRLAPRSQWGEETGESWSDIMFGDMPEGW